MKESYSDLRNAICATQAELIRFRHIVVNSVLATDLLDDDVRRLRDARWKRAFQRGGDNRMGVTGAEIDAMTNRKATALVEHIILAADVAHAMQSWNVYTRWNERHFTECYTSYCSGRMEQIPSITWYANELEFFDSYVIPIAQKLKDCGAFGASSDELIRCAMVNRREWELNGQGIVSRMLEINLSMIAQDDSKNDDDDDNDDDQAGDDGKKVDYDTVSSADYEDDGSDETDKQSSDSNSRQMHQQ